MEGELIPLPEPIIPLEADIFLEKVTHSLMRPWSEFFKNGVPINVSVLYNKIGVSGDKIFKYPQLVGNV
jgi:hypothetical protein